MIGFKGSASVLRIVVLRSRVYKLHAKGERE